MDYPFPKDNPQINQDILSKKKYIGVRPESRPALSLQKDQLFFSGEINLTGLVEPY